MDMWRELGLEGQRVLIVHHDDLGMVEAQNRAYRELGFPTGSVMVAGAWAPQAAQEAGAGTAGAAVAHGVAANRADLGVHLTLTSEWAYPRMRPLTGGASLRDRHGYFWRTVAEAWEHVRAEEAETELRAQIEAALALGIDVTHLDTHMGAVLRPDLARIYHALALEYRVPAMLPRSLDGVTLPEGFRPGLEALLSSSPLPKVHIVDGYAVPPAERKSWYINTLRQLGPGVYHLIHHAAVPTPEAMALPDWEGRRADFEALRDPAVREVMSGFTLITYRQIRDAIRQHLR